MNFSSKRVKGYNQTVSLLRTHREGSQQRRESPGWQPGASRRELQQQRPLLLGQVTNHRPEPFLERCRSLAGKNRVSEDHRHAHTKKQRIESCAIHGGISLVITKKLEPSPQKQTNKLLICLARDAWPMVTRLRQAIFEYTPPKKQTKQTT